MKLTYRQILSAAKLLDQNDRARLRKSLEGIDEPSSVTYLDDEFYLELERRRKYAEKHPESCVSWDQFRRELREKYS